MPTLERIAAPQREPVTLAEAKLHLRVDSGDEDLLIESLIKAARDYVERFTDLSLIATHWRYRLESFPEGGGDIRLPKRPLILGKGTYQGDPLLSEAGTVPALSVRSKQVPNAIAFEKPVGGNKVVMMNTGTGSDLAATVTGRNTTKPGEYIMIGHGPGRTPGPALLIGRADAEDTVRSPVLRYWVGYEKEIQYEQDLIDGDWMAVDGDPPTIRLWGLWNWPIIRTWRPIPVEIDYVAGFGFHPDDVPRPLKQAILLLVGHWYANREAVSQDAGSPVPFTVETILRIYESGEYL